MKYNILKFKDVFVKKVVRFLILESILIFLYLIGKFFQKPKKF